MGADISRAEEDARSPGSGFTDNCGLPGMDSGNQT